MTGLNTKDLNLPLKGYKLDNWIAKLNPIVCQIRIIARDDHRLGVKRRKSTNEKKKPKTSCGSFLNIW